jgi:hypothetical protein
MEVRMKDTDCDVRDSRSVYTSTDDVLAADAMLKEVQTAGTQVPSRNDGAALLVHNALPSLVFVADSAESQKAEANSADDGQSNNSDYPSTKFLFAIACVIGGLDALLREYQRKSSQFEKTAQDQKLVQDWRSADVEYYKKNECRVATMEGWDIIAPPGVDPRQIVAQKSEKGVEGWTKVAAEDLTYLISPDGKKVVAQVQYPDRPKPHLFLTGLIARRTNAEQQALAPPIPAKRTDSEAKESQKPVEDQKTEVRSDQKIEISSETERDLARKDLASVRGKDGTSVLEKLQKSNLSTEQKHRVVDCLASVRAGYAKVWEEDHDQRINWTHTQGELGRVLDVAVAKQLNASDTEGALLASMFSDAVKNKSNFTTHHLAGERAAEQALSKLVGPDFPVERVHQIRAAIREHQIAPPAFMAMIMESAIKRSLAQEGIVIDAEQQKALSSLKRKIENPLTSVILDAPDGGKMLHLTKAERALLARTGNENWYVPSNDSSWHAISQCLVDADGIDNYATVRGLSKILLLRGPETMRFFQDAHFRFEDPGRTSGKPVTSSQQSWKDSFSDFSRVASVEGLALAEQSLAETEADARRAQQRVDNWLKERFAGDPLLGKAFALESSNALPDTIPGWSGKPVVGADGRPMFDGHGQPVLTPDRLKYPDNEQRWWDIHSKPASQRTSEEVDFYNDPVNRYRGLSEAEIVQFKLAKEIRDRYAEELLGEQLERRAPAFADPAPGKEGHPSARIPAPKEEPIDRKVERKERLPFDRSQIPRTDKSGVASNKAVKPGESSVLKQTEGGSIKVVVSKPSNTSTNEASLDSESLSEQELCKLRKAIETNEKMTGEQRENALRGIEVARTGDKKAMDAAKKALSEISRRGPDGAIGLGVGAGILLLAAAGLYSQYRSENSYAEHVPRLKSR